MFDFGGLISDLISRLVPLTLELAEALGVFIRLRVMLLRAI